VDDLEDTINLVNNLEDTINLVDDSIAGKDVASYNIGLSIP
jgi:hypothetical protein